MTEKAPARNRRILVIDDNPAIHGDLRKILVADGDTAATLQETEAALFGGAAETASSNDFEVDSAYQGQEGLELVRKAIQAERPYAMAFVDVRVPPGWDGIETTTHLWQEDPDLQVVICTAYSDYTWAETVEKLRETDRFLILKKPFDNVEVRQLAVALTGKWNLARQTKNQVDELEAAVLERTQALRAEQEQLKKTHAQLLHAQKLESIGQLAAGIAHEINTPIQFVGDNTRFQKDSFDDLSSLLKKYERLRKASRDGSVTAELLAEVEAATEEADLEYLLEEIPRAIEQSLEGVERVAKIVRSMKEFSHPGGDDKQAVDLNKAIESTITVARNEWKYVAEMMTDFDSSLPLVPCILGDFNQVILNIIINAAHAIMSVVGDGAAGKGTITITTRRNGDWAETRIHDTGTGIPEEHRSRVFDHFFTTKEVGKGTGQGLAIAYSVVTEKHGGTITFETETGKGTTFIIRLPIEPESATAEETPQHEEAHSLR